MSKQKNAGLVFEEATPAQMATVKQILEDAAKHRYYVNRIYGIYNAVTGKKEEPQTCSSCLRNRVREIKKWYDEGTAASAKSARKAAVVDTAVKGLQDNPQAKAADSTPDTAEEQAKASELDPNGLPAPAEGVNRIPMEDGTFIDFTTLEGAKFKNGVKGTVLTPTGEKVKAGTYKTAQGHEVKVQVGSKATYVEVYDDLAS